MDEVLYLNYFHNDNNDDVVVDDEFIRQMKEFDEAFDKLEQEGYIVGDYDCYNFLTLRRHESDDPLYIDVRGAMSGIRTMQECIERGFDALRFKRPARTCWTAAEMRANPAKYETGKEMLLAGKAQEAIDFWDQNDMIGWADTLKIIREEVAKQQKLAKVASSVRKVATTTKLVINFDIELGEEELKRNRHYTRQFFVFN